MSRLVQSNEQVVEQIRVNIAFEQMVVGVLAGAFSGAGIAFLLNIVAALSSGAFIAALLTGVLNALLTGFLIFLVGFFASVLIGAPLFTVLEKRKRRNVWPYLAAALGVAIASLVVVVGGVPDLSLSTASALAITVFPAVIVAFVFGRGMQPHWASVSTEKEEQSPKVVSLH